MIFLVSQPRAGSTLLQRMLHAHPDVHSTSEPWIMLPPVFALKSSGLTADYDAKLASRALRLFVSDLNGEQIYWSAVRRSARFLYNAALRRAGKRVFLDKTPRYYFILPELGRVFPQAKFVVLFRNPLAVLASVLDTWVEDRPSQLRFFRNDLVSAPRLLVAGLKELGNRAVPVQYESLVESPESVLRRLCGFLELGYCEQMVRYGDAQQAQWKLGDQGTVYEQRRPIPSRTSRWKEILGRSSLWASWGHEYLRLLGPDLVERMGYSYEALASEMSHVGTRSRLAGVTWQVLTSPESDWSSWARLWIAGFRAWHRGRRSLKKRWYGRQ